MARPSSRSMTRNASRESSNTGSSASFSRKQKDEAPESGRSRRQSALVAQESNKSLAQPRKKRKPKEVGTNSEKSDTKKPKLEVHNKDQQTSERD